MKIQFSNFVVHNRKRYKLKNLLVLFENALSKACNDFQPKIAIISDNDLFLLASAVALYIKRCDGVIIRSELLNSKLENHLLTKGYALFFPDTSVIKKGKNGQNPDPIKNQILVLTSGTMGEPKLVQHTWQSLFTLVQKESFDPNTWLLTYLAGTYAWYQMITLLLFIPAQSLVLCINLEPNEIWKQSIYARVTAISSTPTFWRYLLLKISKARLLEIAFSQITLGGEPVDQAILDQLSSLYPKAGITHIYASTEVGPAIVVKDKKEGFPIEWLDSKFANDRKVSLRIKGKHLWVKSNFSSSQLHGWQRTGDVVKFIGDRVLIIGRHHAKNATINVGGQKADPFQIQTILSKHPQVLWCRVHSKKTPITGCLIAVDVVLSPSVKRITSQELEVELTQFCKNNSLPNWMIPRIWKFLPNIPILPSFKTAINSLP